MLLDLSNPDNNLLFDTLIEMKSSDDMLSMFDQYPTNVLPPHFFLSLCCISTIQRIVLAICLHWHCQKNGCNLVEPCITHENTIIIQIIFF